MATAPLKACLHHPQEGGTALLYKLYCLYTILSIEKFLSDSTAAAKLPANGY